MTDQILLVGLPGSGRHRFQQKFIEHFELEGNAVAFTPSQLFASQTRVWCLIDVRSPLKNSELSDQLKAWLQVSSGVVFNFMESADLASQMYWQKWLKQAGFDLPLLRLFNQNFSDSWSWTGFGQSHSTESVLTKMQKLPGLVVETLVYKVNRLQLEHFLMGVDAAIHNLGMEIYRIKGAIKTVEYENPVAIEITHNRVDTYAAETVTGTLEIQGQNLDEDWFNQLIKACKL